MCYVGDIAPMLAEAKRVLAPGGVFAFTLETHKGDGVVIGAACAMPMPRKSARESHGLRPRGRPSRTGLAAQRG